MIDLNVMRVNAELLRARVNAAAATYRGPKSEQDAIEIIAVSKFHPVEAILQAEALGFNLFGENRVQELSEKLTDPRLSETSFDLIGTLQSNKVKDVVGKVRLIHSLDRDNLLQALEKRAEQVNIIQNVLVQVNYSGENSKHGLTEADLPSFLLKAAQCPHLCVRGLMTMAAPGMAPEQQLAFFQSFKRVFDETSQSLPQGIDRSTFDILSMGMSDDFEAAISAGSNCIRVGRAIFGERNRQSQI